MSWFSFRAEMEPLVRLSTVSMLVLCLLWGVSQHQCFLPPPQNHGICKHIILQRLPSTLAGWRRDRLAQESFQQSVLWSLAAGMKSIVRIKKEEDMLLAPTISGSCCSTPVEAACNYANNCIGRLREQLTLPPTAWRVPGLLDVVVSPLPGSLCTSMMISILTEPTTSTEPGSTFSAAAGAAWQLHGDPHHE